MPRPRPQKKTRNQARQEKQPAAEGERLQKVLAAAGIGSRRKCEELIVEGRVQVDRQTAKLGMRVNPLTQEIRVDGEALRKPKAVYFIVNKPAGVVSTNYDPEYRVRVVDLVKSNERLFTVGRLDQHSEGLILVTNDGELANRLMHPRYEAEKTYRVLVAGLLEQTTLDRLKRGVHLAEGVARVSSINIRKHHPHSTELEMVLQEGKNREIRRVFAAVGHKVLKLRRTQIGPIKLADLPVGAHRPLSKEEVEKLISYANSPHDKKPARPNYSAGPKKPKKAAPPAAQNYEAPLIDESDEAMLDEAALGPVLVDEELQHFDDGVVDDGGFLPRKPGAVIAYEDSDLPLPVGEGRGEGVRPRDGRRPSKERKDPHPNPLPRGEGTREKRKPGRFSKKGRLEREQRGKKKFAKRRDSQGPRGEERGAGSPPRGAKKFAKKFARRKGRS
jgi:23S rRNA pseudouridine2605 synthase